MKQMWHVGVSRKCVYQLLIKKRENVYISSK